MKRTHKSETSRRSPITPAARRALIVSQRLAVAKRFGDARLEGKTWAESSRIAGVSPATISRYGKLLHDHSLDGLEPQTANCGRKSALERWHITPEILAAVAALMQQHGGTARASWLRFAVLPDCPPVLSSHLLKSVPPSLITAVNQQIL